MPITIELPDDLARRLRAVAEARGEDLNHYAVAALSEMAALAEADALDFEESCAAVAEALADESGDMPFEEFVAREKRQRGEPAP